jgi:hypothetical protein
MNSPKANPSNPNPKNPNKLGSSLPNQKLRSGLCLPMQIEQRDQPSISKVSPQVPRYTLLYKIIDPDDSYLHLNYYKLW